MALDFPASPSVNDTYTSGGRTWRWNGTAWVGATPYSGQATITGGTINNTPSGGSTRAAGAFTTVDANSNILSSGGIVGYSSGATVYTIGSGGYNGPVGGSTPAAGAFTTLAANSYYANTSGTGLRWGSASDGSTGQLVWVSTSDVYLDFLGTLHVRKLTGGTASVMDVSSTGLDVTGRLYAQGSSTQGHEFTFSGGGAHIQMFAASHASFPNQIYIDATTHYWRSANAGATFATLNSSGLAVTGSVLINATSSLGGSPEYLTIKYDGASRTGIAIQNTANDYPSNALTVWGHTAGYAGGIQITASNTVSFITSSDARLKTNIRDYNPGDVIDRIRPRIFDWKSGEKNSIGFVAQELHAEYPQAVSVGGEDGLPWGVDFSKLVPVLVAELKSLRARVAQLENK